MKGKILYISPRAKFHIYITGKIKFYLCPLLRPSRVLNVTADNVRITKKNSLYFFLTHQRMNLEY